MKKNPSSLLRLLVLCLTCFRQFKWARSSTLSLCLKNHFPLRTDTSSVTTSDSQTNILLAGH